MKILKVALKEVGYKESPPNSNRTKYGKWYGMDGQPWCDMFISYIANVAGVQKFVGKFAYTPSHAKWFQSKNQWGTRPKVGAIVFFKFGWLRRINHVGIVNKVFKDGSIETIEGNTSYGNERNGGSVMIRTRSKNIVGYGYPAYPKNVYHMYVDSTQKNVDRIIPALKKAGIVHYAHSATKKGILLEWEANEEGRLIIKSVFARLKLKVYGGE